MSGKKFRRLAKIGTARLRRSFGALLAVSIAFGALGAVSAKAEDSVFALRCAGRLVRIGDLKVDVLAKCGPPLYEQYVGERKIRTPRGYDKKILEEWIYNFGPTDFIHILRFEEGRLTEILRGERGYPNVD